MQMPSMQLADSVGTAAAVIGVLAIFAFMALADKEGKRKLAYAAVAVSAAATLVFVGSMWYITPLDVRTEPRLSERHDLAPLGSLGYAEETDGGGTFFAVRSESGTGDGTYAVAIETADGGYAAMTLPQGSTVIYPTDDPGEYRVEKWMDCKVKSYRDGTAETEPLSGLGHEPRYRLYIPADSTGFELNASDVML